MESVSVSRTVDGTPEEIRDVVDDIEAWIAACGFDDVTVDGQHVHITNAVGLLTIELDLRLQETDDLLAYDQADGIFEEMVTQYTLAPAESGTTVTATTQFALDASLVGPILDATVIRRQRRKELERQFDYLEETLETTARNTPQSTSISPDE